MDEHFLDIGGDSLKAMRVLARINQKYGVNLKLRSIFDTGTISLLTEAVESLCAAKAAMPSDT